MSARFRWTLTHYRPAPFNDEVVEVLTKDPLGWDEMTLRLTRDKLYHGVFTEFTLPLKWHCKGGGKVFIDNVYDTYDINGNIGVLIEIDCDSSGTYTELYTGKLNLASYQTDGEYSTLNIERSDLFSKLKARDEIKVDLESTTSIGGETITAVGSKDLPMHAQVITLIGRWDIADGYTYSSPYDEDGDPATFEFLHVTHNANLNSADINVLNAWTESAIITGGFSFLQNPLAGFTDSSIQYPVTVAYEIDFNGVFTNTLNSGTSLNGQYSLSLLYGNPANPTQIILFNHTYSGSGTFSHNYSIQATGTIVLGLGDSIWLDWLVNNGADYDTSTVDWTYDTSFFTISTDTEYEPTQAKSFLVHEAFNQTCDSIADEDLKFYSEFYGRLDSEKITYASDGCGSKIAITNGLNIREFEDKSIFCSLKDLFTTFHALHNIGLTIESVNTIYSGAFEAVRVEPISYFYDTTTEIVALNGGVKVTTTNDNTRYINSVIIGYDKWETEIKGGLDEPNTKHEYSTNVNAVKGQYVKLSPYIASGYGIEATRRKSKFQTEDWKYDNDNFIISVKNFFRGELEFVEIMGLYYILAPALEVGQVAALDTIIIGNTASNNGTFTVYLVVPNPNGGITIYVNEATVNESDGNATLENVYTPLYGSELYEDFLDTVLPTGMIAAFSAYNLRLTPARMLQPHMKSISAGLTKIAGQVKFIRGDGNTELQTQISTPDTCPETYSNLPLPENDSFTWNDGNVIDVTPLWIPEIYKFEYPLTSAQLTAIRANPHGYISVVDDHTNTLTGFILDVEYDLKSGLTSFELLKRYVV